MGRKYLSVTSGAWVQPIRRGYRMRCCDCSLIHRMNFRIHEGRIQFQAFRDDRATSACRRKRR